MPRPVCLFTGQWADLPLEAVAERAARWGYDGLELACWGDHFDVARAQHDARYVRERWELLADHGLSAFALSAHLVGQAVCDRIDERHESILPAHVWGDGEPEGVRARAAQELCHTASAARRFFDAAPSSVAERLALTGRTVVNGFTGSPIWSLMYGFPPATPGAIEAGYAAFARTFRPILEHFARERVHFALEVHPTEIAFDVASTRRTLAALDGHAHFGFNFDPSHLAYQRVDYLGFLEEFGARVLNVHMKDVWWSDAPCAAGVFGGHLPFGAAGRSWDFRSPGRGRVDFEGIVRALNRAGYAGPLTVEWEDPDMEREAGAAESCDFVRRLDFPPAAGAFDAAFAREPRA